MKDSWTILWKQVPWQHAGAAYAIEAGSDGSSPSSGAKLRRLISMAEYLIEAQKILGSTPRGGTNNASVAQW